MSHQSRAERFPRRGGVIKALHPYDVPEIIAIPIIGGNDDYLRWLAEISSLAIHEDTSCRRYRRYQKRRWVFSPTHGPRHPLKAENYVSAAYNGLARWVRDFLEKRHDGRCRRIRHGRSREKRPGTSPNCPWDLR